MADVGTFVTAYPAFQEAGPEQLQAQLDLSAGLLDESAWGDQYDNAVYLDMAHNMAVAQVAASPLGAFQAAVGPASSVSGAGVSTSFNTIQMSDKSFRQNWYSKTVYGQQLLRLWNVVVPPCAAAW